MIFPHEHSPSFSFCHMRPTLLKSFWQLILRTSFTTNISSQNGTRSLMHYLTVMMTTHTSIYPWKSQFLYLLKYLFHRQTQFLLLLCCFIFAAAWCCQCCWHVLHHRNGLNWETGVTFVHFVFGFVDGIRYLAGHHDSIILVRFTRLVQDTGELVNSRFFFSSLAGL